MVMAANLTALTIFSSWAYAPLGIWKRAVKAYSTGSADSSLRVVVVFAGTVLFVLV